MDARGPRTPLQPADLNAAPPLPAPPRLRPAPQTSPPDTRRPPRPPAPRPADHATDTPGIDANIHGDVKFAGGPSITHGTCNHPKVIKRIIKVAEKHKIPLQHESSSRYSGPDTDGIFHVKESIPSAMISFPRDSLTPVG